MTRRAVTLDLWQTLIAEADGSQTSAPRRVLRRELALEALRSLGHNVSEERLQAALYATTARINEDHASGLDMVFDDRVATVLELAQPGLAIKLGHAGVRVVADAIDAAFDASPPQLLPGAGDVLEWLATRDLAIGLISNTGFTSGRAYRRFFDRLGITRHFDVLTFSNDVAAAKPSQSIFTGTLAALGAAPGSTMHVGDNLHADVAGAANAGMATAWVSGPSTGSARGYNRSEPAHPPDFTLRGIADLPAALERWLAE